MRVTLRRGNDQVVTLVGLRTSDTAIWLNAADVKATLLDQKGKPLPAFVNQPMTYIPGSNGTYEWFVHANQMMLPKGVEYQLEVKAQQAGFTYRVVHVVSVVDGEV
jgi:hypothetical protein